MVGWTDERPKPLLRMFRTVDRNKSLGRQIERNIRASEINQVTRFVCAKCLDGIFVAKVASQLPTLFIVAAASGLRIGELLALHNDDRTARSESMNRWTRRE
jgi:integrase